MIVDLPISLIPTFYFFKTKKYCSSLKLLWKLFHFSDFLKLLIG